MRINLGFDDYHRNQGKRDVPVIWDPDTLINAHMFMCGKSGMGKSYQLLNFIAQALNTAGPAFERYHNLDVHGDLLVEGESRVEFSGRTRYGYNPLVLDPSPASGGVNRQINFLISTINQTSRKIMDRQEATLRNLLFDVYAAYGITEEDQSTWVRKEMTEAVRRDIWARGAWSERFAFYPTLDDVIEAAERKLMAMYGGLNASEAGRVAVHALEEMGKAAAKMHRCVTTAQKKIDVEEREIAQKQLDVAKANFRDRVETYINTIETGREFSDLIKYDSKEVLKGVIDRLKNFKAIGIFNANPPPFDPAARVWSYDLTNLEEEEKYIFCKVRAQYIFRRRKLAGPVDQVCEIIGADEAHNLFDDNPDSIYNKIAKEARKFGLALWAVSQTPSDFPEGVITTVGTKILLGIDSFYWAASCKKLNIEEKVLKFIQPRRTIAVYMDKKGATASRFIQVQLAA